VLGLIPEHSFYGFDHLMLDMLRHDRPVHIHPFGGLWLDIGRPDDYDIANDTVIKHRDRFFPGECLLDHAPPVARPALRA
jgi:NDP-sugar pyrophosphorylase family protein